MLEIFQYAFFQNALLAVLILSIGCGIVGTYVVTRRLVFIAGGITHASFGGLGIGFFLGVHPTLTALAFAVLSAFGVEWVSKRGNIREDSVIAAFWSLGMAIGIIFVFLTPGYTPGLTEFLFGNILTITYSDIVIFLLYTILLLVFLAKFFKPLIFVAFDRDFAHTRCYPARQIEYAMMFFVAVCIVLSIRLVGIMLMMSLLTIPQNIAMLYRDTFKGILLLSAATSIVAGVSGLYLSYLLNVPAGACIVFILVIFFLLAKGAIVLYRRRK